MNYLLDTCVLSEFTRHVPNSKLIQWLDTMDESSLFLSVITVGEIQRGITRLVESRRQKELIIWMDTVINQRFQHRILSITAQTMLTWGALTARLEKEGHPMPVMDSLIAATVIENNLSLITRNVADFSQCGIQIINPWE
ncbi:MAG: VapC toxin family PIN domain ribonuclease [Anaerolineaceae bacterium]|nr:VapC toxin family PIN domain ribonuclease [Anaerolineaceae bacterium]